MPGTFRRRQGSPPERPVGGRGRREGPPSGRPGGRGAAALAVCFLEQRAESCWLINAVNQAKIPGSSFHTRGRHDRGPKAGRSPRAWKPRVCGERTTGCPGEAGAWAAGALGLVGKDRALPGAQAGATSSRERCSWGLRDHLDLSPAGLAVSCKHQPSWLQACPMAPLLLVIWGDSHCL